MYIHLIAPRSGHERYLAEAHISVYSTISPNLHLPEGTTVLTLEVEDAIDVVDLMNAGIWVCWCDHKL